MKVSPDEIRAVCQEIKRQGIRAVAISGVYSPIDFDLHQEELVESIVRAEIPGVFTTVSKKVANLGLLERENATILNTALLRFAAVTVEGFEAAARDLELSCPVFLTSNEGTLMSTSTAAALPIRSFSSGPTNSMRGAAFLASLASGGARQETALVVDVGGTTVSGRRSLILFWLTRLCLPACVRHSPRPRSESYCERSSVSRVSRLRTIPDAQCLPLSQAQRFPSSSGVLPRALRRPPELLHARELPL